MKQQQTMAELFKADSEGLELEQFILSRKFWGKLNMDYYLVVDVKEMNEFGHIRIKPKTKYYRVYRDETGHKCIRSQSDSFMEWSAWQEKKSKGHLFIHLFDHEVTE